MTAIHAEPDGGHSAYRVQAIGLYRDMEGRGGENVLVPLYTEDLQLSQSHYYLNRRELNARLPNTVVDDVHLFESVSLEGDGCPVHFDRDTLSWAVTL